MECIKNFKNKESIIKNSYDFFVKTHKQEPQLAVCEIEWKEDAEREEVLIGLGITYDDALDELTTFNCTDINDFLRLCNGDGEDFKVTRFKEFKGND